MRFLLSLALGALALGACTSKKDEAPKAASVAQASRALEVPRDRVWAASTHLRVVDAAAGQVVAGAQLGRAINDLAFAPDGRRAYVASSDGVYEVDVESTKLGRKLTTSPARQLLLSPDGRSLGVLEHDVVVGEDGSRTVKPFRWKTVNVEDGAILSEEVAGERVLAVAPGYGVRHSAVLFESGTIMKVAPGVALAKGGEALDLNAGVDDQTKGRALPRQYVAFSRDRTRAYFPVEGTPSRVLELNLSTGASRAFALDGPARLRGLALSLDEKQLLVNALNRLVVLELDGGKIEGSVELGAPHTGVALAEDGRRAYLAQTIDEKGGAVTVVSLSPLRVQGKIHLDDLSPWVIGVAPRTAVAGL